MPLNFDAETIGKIYTPIGLAIAALWKLYLSREKKREAAEQKRREIHQALVDATILKCELERKEDRKECREQTELLRKRLDEAQDKQNAAAAQAFDRMADALDVMVKRKRASDPDSAPYPTVKPRAAG